MQAIKLRLPGEAHYQDATLYRGKPLADRPKTYKEIGVFGHNIGNAYNPGWGNLLKAADGSLRYEIYRDGCFYPYYGKLILKGAC